MAEVPDQEALSARRSSEDLSSTHISAHRPDWIRRLLLAFLLDHGLWKQGLTFLTDGQKTLQGAILRAVRQTLGLRNSSNHGEKANDLVISKRQKHNGMSWSPEGSVSLAAVTTLVRNQGQDTWFNQNIVPMEFPRAA